MKITLPFLVSVSQNVVDELSVKLDARFGTNFGKEEDVTDFMFAVVHDVLKRRLNK